MKRPLVFVMSAVGTAFAALTTLGVGTAAANNEYVGRTYAEAASSITGNGAKVAIATVVGEQLPTDDCVVTGSRKSSNLDSSGRSRGYQIVLDLNCNQPVAAAGKSGNSAASTSGAQAKKIMGWIEGWNEGSISSCVSTAENAKWCLAQCTAYGGCTAEIQQAFAAAS